VLQGMVLVALAIELIMEAIGVAHWISHAS
jgi:hypothetical protein